MMLVEMRRVVFLLPALTGGGAERATAVLASVLPPERFEPLLVLQQRSPHTYAVDAHVRVVELDADSPLKTIAPLRRLLAGFAPDVVYSALPHLNALAVALARTMRPRPRVIVSVHNNTALEYADLEKRWLWLGEPVTYMLADAIVCVSQGLAENLRTLRQRDREKARVIPDPIDVMEVAGSATDGPAHPWFDGTHQVVVAAGRLTLQKDYPTLIRAFASIQAIRPEARLMILGDGPLRQEITSLVADLELGAVVAMPGRVDNPYPYLGAAACFVQASRYEGFGMAIVEALAAGAPVAATDCPFGPREVLDDGRLGLLSTVGDAPGLAANVERLLHDHDLAGRLRREGPIWARRYAPSEVGWRLVQLIEDLCR
jgi:glycosyltransferase involved in cell wall biosynthesis